MTDAELLAHYSESIDPREIRDLQAALDERGMTPGSPRMEAAVAELKRAEDRRALLDNYQEAVALALRLDDTPRWLRRRRRRTEEALTRVCREADRLRTVLGGRRDAPGLRTIIDESLAEMQ